MRTILITSILLLLMACSNGSHEQGQEKIHIATVAMSDTVYICDSEGAKRFHASDTCKGLSNCGSDIITLTREDAEDTGRTYCHKCYER